MQFNITFKTIFEYVLKKIVLCIQIRFVSTEKTTRIASRASCFNRKYSFLCHSLSWAPLEKLKSKRKKPFRFSPPPPPIRIPGQASEYGATIKTSVKI